MQGDAQISRGVCQPADRLNEVTHSDGEETGKSAASASNGDAAVPQSTAAFQGSSDDREIHNFEPVQQHRAKLCFKQFESNLEAIIEKQLRMFEHKLSGICDAALAKLQEHVNEAMQPRDPDKVKSVNRA